MEQLRLLENEMTRAIDSAGHRLMKKIRKLNIEKLSISEYNTRKFNNSFVQPIKGLKVKRRLKKLIKQMRGISNAYPQQHIEILKILFQSKTIEDLPKIAFFEHGGGIGHLSLLAAELGVGKVYYNDVYDVSCRESALIAETLGHRHVTRIHGEIEDIEAFCKEQNVLFDCIGSYDVIEHIYDIDGFLKKISNICAPDSNIFLLSGANPHNQEYVQNIVPVHDEAEHENRAYKYGHKMSESLQAYSSIRAEIIKNHYLTKDLPVPDADTLETLVASTKGLVIWDIQHAVDAYTEGGGGILPLPDSLFPSNTCDPMTGEWLEHLMDFTKLLSILDKSFHFSSIYPTDADLSESSYIGLYASKPK